MAHNLTASQALARLHSAGARHRSAMQRVEAAVVRKSTIVLASAGFGAMTRYKTPVAIKGFPWKLGAWALLTVAEAMTKGMTQQVAGALGDATLANYTHDAVAAGSLIAGDEGSI